MHRWILAQPDRAAISESVREMADVRCNVRAPKALDKTRWSTDEQCIQDIQSTVASMINPFSYSSNELVSLSSGAVASADVTSDMLSAQTRGEQAAVR